ncbi:hypothetical protein JFN85_23510 [Enterobacter hormaechei subsp. xiangfangensis]|nr:hypothetical protein JFN85_23510 [Enterobacter hormaechei subsp. xiangfangensis]
MTRALAVILALVLALLGWQSWRLNNAGHTIGTQAEALKKNKQELAKKNSQLISLSILTETNSRAQMQLYAGSGGDFLAVAESPAPDRGAKT